MNSIFRASLLFILLGSPALLATNCSSDKKEDPQPTTGSLAGTVSPVGSITKVTATDAGGLTFPATPDASTGAFSISDLKPGTYELSFTPAAGYFDPGVRSITIVAGQKAAAGTVTAESDGSLRSGTMSWSVAGTTYTANTVTGNISDVGGAGTSLSVTATANNGAASDQLSIFIGGFDLSTGTYQLGGFYQSASYQRTNGGVPTGTYGGQNASTGTFTVTNYDANTKTLTGTFGVTAAEQNGQGGSLTVNNGTFTLRF